MGTRGVLDVAAEVRDAAPRFDPHLALLLLHGGADDIARAADTRRFAERVGCTNAVKVFDGMRHEVFNEADSHRTFAAVDGFCRLSVAGQAASIESNVASPSGNR